MNRPALPLIPLLLMSFLSRAQATLPLQPACNTPLRVIKRDSTGTYWGCDTRIYYEGNKGIKIFDASYHLLEEGENVLRVCSQLSYRSGRWSFYYPNGQLESTGIIHRKRLSGVWRYYYEHGQLKETVTYDTIYHNRKNGLYELYARNGKPVERGCYCLYLDPNAMDTIIEMDPVTEKETVIIRKSTSPGFVRCGEWKSYDERGVLIRRKTFPVPPPFKRQSPPDE